ncbi:MAG: selenocysteine-specific translation elongation factor [Anaerolineae bacterium]
MRVIGTAGHVDHGKSTLVEALTGSHPDRLKEEREREMTIDLGFAWLTLPGGESVSIVDVPGHEDFIKNMLAGVGGIDAALLVIAADEGVMPQTREHLAILDLLKVGRGVVALTKTDMVDDPEWLDLVRADVAETLKPTSLADVPIMPVSARKRQGLADLLATLEAVLADTPGRLDQGRPRLPVDRVFTIQGFGTVVTGTLIDGRFKVGDEVEILPQGLKARIRGLQTHKQKIETAAPGSRVAINLGGVSTEDIRRGDVVTRPGWLKPTRMLDVQLRLLPDAPHPIRHNAALDFFTGASEMGAHVRLLGVQTLEPGQTAWAQLVLAEPAVVVKGDRFILRQPSPSLTIGGGVVIDAYPTRRHRRFRPEVVRRLETLAHGTPTEILLAAIQRAEPVEARVVTRASNLGDAADEALRALVRDGAVVALVGGGGGEAAISPPTLVASAAGWTALLDRLVDTVGDYHRQYPLRVVMPREEARTRVSAARATPLPPKVFNLLVESGVAGNLLAATDTGLRLPQHAPRFSAAQQAAVDRVLAAFRAQPYSPPPVGEAVAQVGADVFGSLVEQGVLVRVSEDVAFTAEAYHTMMERVVAILQQNGKITVAEVRDAFGTSRKYALALMEHLDERRITRRVGDERVLR